MVFDLGADQRDSMTEHDQGPLMWISNNGEKKCPNGKKNALDSLSKLWKEPGNFWACKASK